MSTISLVECFLVSAESGSFSAAARRLSLTPAAVSKNVARLEAQLGLRLFQRSTRSLTLTSGGERFLHEASAPFEGLQAAMTRAGQLESQPAGTLKVAVGVGFGREYLVPLLTGFLERYPSIVPDWQFDNRPVDLIKGGFDVAVGGGIELAQDVIARELAPAHAVVVASPTFMKQHGAPKQPQDLGTYDGIVRRSLTTGRLHPWTLRNTLAAEALAQPRTRLVFDDPEAMVRAVQLGLGVALVPMPHALPGLRSGELVRLLPGWHAVLGLISLYYPSKVLLPLKTRAFIDFVVEQFRAQRLAKVLDAR